MYTKGTTSCRQDVVLGRLGMNYANFSLRERVSCLTRLCTGFKIPQYIVLDGLLVVDFISFEERPFVTGFLVLYLETAEKLEIERILEVSGKEAPTQKLEKIGEYCSVFDGYPLQASSDDSL